MIGIPCVTRCPGPFGKIMEWVIEDMMPNWAFRVSTDVVEKYGGLVWFIFGFRSSGLCLCTVSDSLLEHINASMRYCHVEYWF